MSHTITQTTANGFNAWLAVVEIVIANIDANDNIQIAIQMNVDSKAVVAAAIFESSLCLGNAIA